LAKASAVTDGQYGYCPYSADVRKHNLPEQIDGASFSSFLGPKRALHCGG
jgi:hypothetical protein